MPAESKLWTQEPSNNFFIRAHSTTPIGEETIRVLQRGLDPHTVGHQHRVGEFSALLAHHAGLDNLFRAHASGLGEGHDCGKGHPEVAGQLYAEEELGIAYSDGKDLPCDRWNVIGMHPRIAATRALELRLPPLYVVGFKNHHTPRERTPGHRGVTLREVGETYGPDIVLLTEILQIADSLDSMVNPHYLKQPKPLEVAHDEILELMEAGRYNPLFADAFEGMYTDTRSNRKDLFTLAA